jgi:hypothetical protein
LSTGDEPGVRCGPVVVGLDGDDQAAVQWLIEVVHPWFPLTDEAPDVRVTVSTAPGAYAAIPRPAGAKLRPCFALDRKLVAFPSWPVADGIALDDAERGCVLVVSPAQIALVGDPSTRRWRFTLQLVLIEIAATLARRTALDLHAAAVARGGRAIAIAGPKRAGKTTLSLHLLRSGLCRWIANDRAFAARENGALVVRGVPAAVKIQPETVVAFPELRHGLASRERPYLQSVAEVCEARGGDARDAAEELALSPAQLACQLGLEPLAAAPLGTVVFPEIVTDAVGFVLERLDPPAAAERLWQNLYGYTSGARKPTIFEQCHGGRSEPSRELARAVAESAAAFRVGLGRDAYQTPDFARRLLDSVSP